MQRDFTAERPVCKLVGDITYIRTWEGWLYLATVIDCHTRGVVGWSMAEHMRTDLVADAITMATGNVELDPNAVFHSDRGTQFTSTQFAEHLAAHNITASMGRTGVCWDNALAESFFAALKNELVHRTVFPTRAKARRAIAEYIEVFYNRQRLHSGWLQDAPGSLQRTPANPRTFRVNQPMSLSGKTPPHHTTLPEVRGLLAHLIWNQPPNATSVLHWSHWRRRHQARARRCHYTARGVPP